MHYIICLQVTPYLAQYFPVTFSAIQPYVSMYIVSACIIYYICSYVVACHNLEFFHIKLLMNYVIKNDLRLITAIQSYDTKNAIVIWCMYVVYKV